MGDFHVVSQQDNLGGVFDPIPVVEGDNLFPEVSGGDAGPFMRSLREISKFGPYQSPNNFASSFIDLSPVYGSDDTEAKRLRTGQGGKLREGELHTLPPNDAGCPLSNPLHQDPTKLPCTGDSRAGTDPMLQVLHAV